MTIIIIKPFSTNVPLLYPLKTSENLWFSDVFRGYRSGTFVKNGLITTFSQVLLIGSFSLYSLADGHIKWENSALFRLVFPVWNRQKQSSEVFCQRGIRTNLQN